MSAPEPLLTLFPDTPDESSGGRFARWSRDPRRWLRRLNEILFLFLLVITITGIQLSDLSPSFLQVAAGDISEIDVRAPRSITYQSVILTREARDHAAAAVSRVFDPPQNRIAREQIGRGQNVLEFITQVRSDPYASAEQKSAWLLNIAGLSLDEAIIRAILELDDKAWLMVSNETISVLDKAMRQEIREGELGVALRTVPGQVAFGLGDAETTVVSAIVQGLLRPNTFYNEERTKAAQTEAAAAVQTVDRTITAGEIIVRAGDRLDDLDIETLEVLGLRRVARTWHDYVAALMLGLLIASVFMAFINYRRQDFWQHTRQVYLLAAIVIGFAITARLMTSFHTILPYLYPLAAMTMLITVLFELPIALVATMLIGLLIAIFTQGETEIVTHAVLGGLVGAMAMGRAERLNSFARAGLWVAGVGLVILTIFRLPTLGATDSLGFLQLATASALNGIFASSFALVVLYLLSQLFGLTTSLQLLELSRPTHPLLRQLLLKAPGTYHHTLMVSNMAEEAATAIGADALLTRVGSYYHDIGKSVRPYFFVENVGDSMNPHDRLDPYTSARIIVSHVSDGVNLGRKHRLPETIIDFIREHHGTTRVEYFYHRASQEHEMPEPIDENAFRYKGPRPRHRETAILMLADGCEATVRAMNPPTQEEMSALIRNVINRRLMLGQLDDSQLTLKDLSQIADAFVRVLTAIHHPRIQYPGDMRTQEPMPPTPASTPSTPASTPSTAAVPMSQPNPAA